MRFLLLLIFSMIMLHLQSMIYYESKLSHVFLGALIYPNKPGYAKNAIEYLIGDLLKRAFWGNAVNANEANKSRERTNARDSDDDEYIRNAVKWNFKCFVIIWFSLSLFKFWQIIPDLSWRASKSKYFVIRQN